MSFTENKTGPKRLRRTRRDTPAGHANRKVWDGPPPKANREPVMLPEDFTADPLADVPLIPFGETDEEREVRLEDEAYAKAEAEFFLAQENGEIRPAPWGKWDDLREFNDWVNDPGLHFLDEFFAEPECRYCGGPCNVRDFPL